MVRRVASVLALLAALSAAPISARADQYQYDVLGRLTQVTYSSGGVTIFTYDNKGNILAVSSLLPTSAVEEPSSTEARYQFALGQNIPNPGSGLMSVRFSIPTRGHVVLRVFDVQGKLVMTPLDATLDPGAYTTRIRAQGLAGGVYFYRLEAGGKSLARRFAVLP